MDDDNEQLEQVEPHAVLFRRACPICGAEALDVVTIPRLATGEFFPQFAACDACGAKINFLERAPAMNISEVERAVAEEQRP